MTPDEYNFFSFMLDAVKVLVELLAVGAVGAGIENKWHLVQRIQLKITNKSRNQQSQNASGSGNAAVQGQNINAPVTINMNGGLPEDTPYPEKAFVECVEKIFQSEGRQSTFSDCFKDGEKHTRYGAVPQAAASYFKGFLQIQFLYFEHDISDTRIPQERLVSLQSQVSQLKQFSDEARSDALELKTIIDALRASLTSISPYV